VLFLDSVEGKYLEELGGMNIVLVYRDGTLVTPKSDTILSGITRDSVLTLARDRGHTVESRPITIDEWKAGHDSGDIVEAFACGTAATVVPIGQLKGLGFTLGSENAQAGEVTLALRKELIDVQYGRTEDTHSWMVRLDS